MVIDIHPEFGYEMACSMPYAYWLHKKGESVKVITCKGMKPFYYFCDEVEEKYNHRSVNNSINGVQNLPNSWIHHNADVVFGKDYSFLSEEQKIEVNGVSGGDAVTIILQGLNNWIRDYNNGDTWILLWLLKCNC